jgi:hypothetical protein
MLLWTMASSSRFPAGAARRPRTGGASAGSRNPRPAGACRVADPATWPRDAPPDTTPRTRPGSGRDLGPSQRLGSVGRPSPATSRPRPGPWPPAGGRGDCRALSWSAADRRSVIRRRPGLPEPVGPGRGIPRRPGPRAVPATGDRACRTGTDASGRLFRRFCAAGPPGGTSRLGGRRGQPQGLGKLDTLPDRRDAGPPRIPGPEVGRARCFRVRPGARRDPAGGSGPAMPGAMPATTRRQGLGLDHHGPGQGLPVVPQSPRMAASFLSAPRRRQYQESSRSTRSEAAKSPDTFRPRRSKAARASSWRHNTLLDGVRTGAAWTTAAATATNRATPARKAPRSCEPLSRIVMRIITFRGLSSRRSGKGCPGDPDVPTRSDTSQPHHGRGPRRRARQPAVRPGSRPFAVTRRAWCRKGSGSKSPDNGAPGSPGGRAATAAGRLGIGEHALHDHVERSPRSGWKLTKSRSPD